MTYRVNLKKTSYLKFEGYTVSEGSNGYGLFVHEALSKTVATLTGQNNILISNYFGKLDSWLRTYANNGCGADYLLTIGKLLKGRLKEKDNTDIALTSSLSTLIEGLQSIFCIGYTYEYEQGAERVVIEDLEYFFQDYEILTFNDISDFEITPAQDLIFNTIEVGYEKYETEEVNGADEFNSKRHYSTPIRKHENKLNILSKLIAGGYPIEFTRQSRLRSADYKYDNNNFIIAVKNDIVPPEDLTNDKQYQIIEITDNGEVVISSDALEQLNGPEYTLTITDSVGNDGTYNLVAYYQDALTDEFGNIAGFFVFMTLDPMPANTEDFGFINFLYPDDPGQSTTRLIAKLDDAFTTLNNVIDPTTIYNAEISPVRNLLRWAKYINGGLTYKQPTEVLKFTYGEANYLLESQLKETETCLGGDISRTLVKENQDFILSDFNQFERLWIAEYVSFKSECSYGDFLTIRENLLPDVAKSQKNGYISVNYLDDQYQGYPIEVNYEPNKRICTFKLLRKANIGDQAAPVENLTATALSDTEIQLNWGYPS
jgi:hypothetical protein